MMTAAVVVVIVMMGVMMKMMREEEVAGGGERDTGRLSLMTSLRLNSEREERYVAHILFGMSLVCQFVHFLFSSFVDCSYTKRAQSQQRYQVSGNSNI